MCLILFSYEHHPHYKLILASNRDEFYERPTKALHKWAGNKGVFAGQDELNKGTWLGLSQDWKISAITNYRDLLNIKDDAPSRGLLVSGFLKGAELPENYLNEIRKSAGNYNGYNLIVGDKTGMFYFSNIKNKIERVAPGVHGLNNRFLDTDWPKVTYGKRVFEQLIGKKKELPIDEIFKLLNDDKQPSDSELPDTGVGIEWERILAPIFIKTEVYGTRTSSIVTIDQNDRITFIEKSFLKTSSGSFDTKIIEFNL